MKSPECSFKRPLWAVKRPLLDPSWVRFRRSSCSHRFFIDFHSFQGSEHYRRLRGRCGHWSTIEGLYRGSISGKINVFWIFVGMVFIVYSWFKIADQGLGMVSKLIYVMFVLSVWNFHQMLELDPCLLQKCSKHTRTYQMISKTFFWEIRESNSLKKLETTCTHFVCLLFGDLMLWNFEKLTLWNVRTTEASKRWFLELLKTWNQ